jgi:hypothetical protein
MGNAEFAKQTSRGALADGILTIIMAQAPFGAFFAPSAILVVAFSTMTQLSFAKRPTGLPNS